MSFEDDGLSTEEHERRITRCRDCRERIVFLDKPNSGKIPVDADTVGCDDIEYDPDGDHVAHAATCSANKARKIGPGRRRFSGF